MKSKLAGWLTAAVVILVVVAIASRVAFIRNLVFPQAQAAA